MTGRTGMEGGDTPFDIRRMNLWRFVQIMCLGERVDAQNCVLMYIIMMLA